MGRFRQDDTATPPHSRRGRPPRKTERRWEIRGAILTAVQAVNRRLGRSLKNPLARIPTADIVAILDPSGTLYEEGNRDQRASLERAIRAERRALRHGAARDPDNPFMGLFVLPLARAKAQQNLAKAEEKRRKVQREKAEAKRKLLK